MAYACICHFFVVPLQPQRSIEITEYDNIIP